jgi:Second Messenger Oligonucleotide or Dinucleotide Synthetase domain
LKEVALGLLSSLYSLESTTIETIPPSVPSGYKWIAVRQRFEQFHRKLSLTLAQTVDGHTKRKGVINCLNRHYYGVSFGEEHSLVVGSWGKGTATRPPRDVDIYFIIPYEVYLRYEGRSGNRQSALLQEVKSVLCGTYPSTEMRGDGQVVVVRFSNSYSVEVVPAILLQNGRYWICDTAEQGKYRVTDPQAEAMYIENVDISTNRNLRPLIRMLKSWQAFCSVPIKSFQIELVAAEFLVQSPWRQHDYFWFDWILRDFFVYLYSRSNSYVRIPGTSELSFLGCDWQSRAANAWNRAFKACEYEQSNYVAAAGEEWQKIFGPDIPERPTWI